MSSDDNFTLAGFFRSLAQGKLLIAQCIKCGRKYLPPRHLCSKCHTTKFRWVEASGSGLIDAYSVIHVTSDKFAEQAPYVVAIVRLDEGIAMPGIIRNASKDEVTIGAKVHIRTGAEPSKYFFELDRLLGNS